MSESLRNKVIVVTGGFGVLGSSLGLQLLEKGAHVALLDKAETPPAGLDFDRTLALGGVDLTCAESACAALAQVAGRFGRIDGLVNVAGGFAWETVEGGSLTTWDRLYQMNLRTAVVGSQAVLPHLLEGKGGRIINIGAQASVKAGMGMGAYAASKAGVARLTEALAEELKDRGITVNAVLPSIIDTPTNRADMPGAEFDRWVTPAQLAAVIGFLLADAASAVTGACIPVSGRV